MGSQVVKWSLGLAYGFASIIALIVVHQVYCGPAGCAFTTSEGECGFPAALLVPFAFTSFITPSIAAFALTKKLKRALLFGAGGLAAWLSATATIMMLSQECAPLLAIANVSLYSTFISSAGAFIANYGGE